MYVVLIHYKCELAEIESNLAAHIDYLDHYYARGKFLASGRKNPRIGGVILASTETRQELDNILADDPFQYNDLADYQVIEFIASKAIPPLAYLQNL